MDQEIYLSALLVLIAGLTSQMSHYHYTHILRRKYFPDQSSRMIASVFVSTYIIVIGASYINRVISDLTVVDWFYYLTTTPIPALVAIVGMFKYLKAVEVYTSGKPLKMHLVSKKMYSHIESVVATITSIAAWSLGSRIYIESLDFRTIVYCVFVTVICFFGAAFWFSYCELQTLQLYKVELASGEIFLGYIQKLTNEHYTIRRFNTAPYHVAIGTVQKITPYEFSKVRRGKKKENLKEQKQNEERE